jgi:hypothetical protein
MQLPHRFQIEKFTGHPVTDSLSGATCPRLIEARGKPMVPFPRQLKRVEFPIAGAPLDEGGLSRADHNQPERIHPAQRQLFELAGLPRRANAFEEEFAPPRHGSPDSASRNRACYAS